MKISEEFEAGRVRAQTITRDTHRYWDFGDGLILLPEGWDPLRAQKYYLDVDAVLDEANTPG